jgi:hypothetical protein
LEANLGILLNTKLSSMPRMICKHCTFTVARHG